MTYLHFKKITYIKENRFIKHVISFLLLTQMSHASTYTLNKVLGSANQNSALSKAIKEESLSLEAKNKASTTSDPFELFATGTKAYPYPGQGVQGNEYSMGLSKKIILGNIQKEEQKIASLSNQAHLIEEEGKILSFTNGLKNLYHQHCLEYQNYKSFQQSYLDFVTLYEKKQKAYTYQEISKTELMQLELEKNGLYAQLQDLQMRQKISKQKLFTLSQINDDTGAKLSCQDMYPIKSTVKLSNSMFSLSKKAYQKRVESTQETLKRYTHPLESIDLSVAYGKELDRDKYSVGVSAPLNFTSKRSEHERVAALHKNSAVSFEHEQMMLEKQGMTNQLLSQLKNNASMLKTLQENYKSFKNTLLPQIEKSYQFGESSVIEYLLSRQKSYQLQEEMISLQKTYYNTLFTLYIISETKDKQ